MDGVDGMRKLVFWGGLLLLAFQLSAYAEDIHSLRSHERTKTVSVGTVQKASSEEYWTPERLKNAKPRMPSLPAGQILNGKKFTKSKESARGQVEGTAVTNPRRPGVRVKPDTENRLFVPETENHRPRENQSAQIKSSHRLLLSRRT